jgi:hypothetical protein
LKNDGKETAKPPLPDLLLIHTEPNRRLVGGACVATTRVTGPLANDSIRSVGSDKMLDALQRDAFEYFLQESTPVNGLVADKTQPDSPASIASVGFALAFPKEPQGKPGWTSPYHYGINLGPVVLMCENFRSGLLWRLMQRCSYLVAGLRQAGFANGWLWEAN